MECIIPLQETGFGYGLIELQSSSSKKRPVLEIMPPVFYLTFVPLFIIMGNQDNEMGTFYPFQLKLATLSEQTFISLAKIIIASNVCGKCTTQ